MNPEIYLFHYYAGWCRLPSAFPIGQNYSGPRICVIPLTAFPDMPTRFPQAITPQLFQDRGFPTPNRDAMKVDGNAI